MKTNKTFALILAAMLVIALLTGCSKEEGSSGQDADLPTVGIVQIVEHPSLDTIRISILDQLAEEGFVDGENMTVDYQNAQNDQTILKTICQKFASGNYDLIIAIATPSAQAALGETTEIPIVFSAVTDPLAAELVDSLEAPGGNVTGTSDAVSAEMIMDLALEITPDIKTIGALYNTSEVNSVSVINDLKEYAAAKGLTVVEGPVMNASEVQQSATYLAGKVDAVFSPIDNTVASAMPIITKTLNDAKIPFYVGADSMVNDGGLATYGINYTVLGKETGKMAAEVLKGDDPGTMPVMTMKDMDIYINQKTADQIGVVFPQSVLDKATVLGE
ncbi:ABC transporter substrate-binding protein [Sinanaerobacter chloroacetimidivorans]|uniref:ABC transporter substrate-binding protein n=1 Tax=Sinanaerobacter chloroacetimidivorans TaxID=2818044 RepID=A0A8J8B237_9FIRM|nr:ABC transporter substrate-binding protein [Sinanaerobacter chloroacetimidivorans]MBR0598884.1 ABC transporter substrate-binding protein [Sinanaerobacter chloroacetimidivorans]